MKKILLLLLLFPSLVFASASQTTPGYLTTTGCPGATSPCFVPYSSTNPLPVTASATSITGLLPVANIQYGSSNQCLTTNSGGTAAVWGSCSGSSTSTFGTSTSATSPNISGDATSGFYTAGARKIDASISGTQIWETNSTGFNLLSGSYLYGTPAITDTGIVAQFTGNNASYIQQIIQNTSNGTGASADLILANNLGTASTYFGDLGINSSTFTGSGSFNLPNATYLYSQNGDLALGTAASNAIHFVINNGTTDAMNIATNGKIGVGQYGIANLANNNAQMLVETFNDSNYETANIGFMGSAQADASNSSIWGVGIYGHGYTNNAQRSAGIIGEGLVTNSADTGASMGVRGYSDQTHAGGINAGLYGDAVGGASNYALYMNNGNIFSANAQTWTLFGSTSGLNITKSDGTTSILNLDSTNQRVGIGGIITPASPLDVGGAIDINGINAISFPSGESTAGGSIGIGYQALVGETTSAVYSNTAIGYNSMHGVLTTGGSQNTAIGNNALGGLTSGSLNVAVGSGAGSATSIGTQNVYIGRNAGVSAANAYNNTVIGTKAGTAITSGSSNTIIGSNVASTTLVTGSSNILIGTSSSVDAIAAATNNEINIGGLLFYNKTSTAAPVVSSCGTSPTIDSHANAKSGTVTVGTGSPTGCTITFASAYSSWNHCRITSQGVNAAFAYSYSLTAITLSGTALSGNIDYDCDGY